MANDNSNNNQQSGQTQQGNPMPQRPVVQSPRQTEQKDWKPNTTKR